jgi:hypothetical protein
MSSIHRTRVAATLAGSLLLLGTDIVLAAPPWSFEPRTIDGTGNNPAHPEWGSVGVQLLRMGTVAYDDDISAPGGVGRPSPRLISNMVCAQSQMHPNPGGASDYLWQWGQFLDHDIALIDPAEPAEPFNIPVPLGDPQFDPDWTGTQVIFLDRSQYDPDTGTGPDNPRQQTQSITSFIDASQVYGSDPVRAAALRTFEGGRLATSDGDLLPYNLDGLPNLGGPDPSLFLAGDIRCNEQVALTSMHTLWVREHNWWADRLAAKHRKLTDEQVYQWARRIVGAEIQVITFQEFLPILIGPDAIDPYDGYDPDVEATLVNLFSTAAYRVGHTLLSPMIRRLDADGQPWPYGDVALRDAFFAPQLLTDEGGIAPILRGLASQMAQDVDVFVIDDVRNFLFGEPGAGGFDLPSLNIQRGRDHGLPCYNQARIDYGLDPMAEFQQITADTAIQQKLAAAYSEDVDAIDPWVGGLAEDHVDGAMVGPLLQAIIADQFTRLRDGDRFWYQSIFHGHELAMIESTRLSDVIRRNTEIDGEIADDVFRVQPGCNGDVNGDGAVDVHDLIEILNAWGDAGGPADLNDDGIVDVQDLVIVIVNWGCE